MFSAYVQTVPIDKVFSKYLKENFPDRDLIIYITDWKDEKIYQAFSESMLKCMPRTGKTRLVARKGDILRPIIVDGGEGTEILEKWDKEHGVDSCVDEFEIVLTNKQVK